MKILPVLFAIALLPTAGLHAQAPFSPRSGATTYDNVVEFSYAGRAELAEGSRRLGQILTTQVRASTVVAVPFDAENQLLAGFGAQWFDFDAPTASLVPDDLSSVAAKLGRNRRLGPQWTVRAEADPGVYGAGSFGAPLAVRAIYAASRELQWALGFNYDWRSGHPLVGGLGVRWQFAPDWTLARLLPAPRIEWAIARGLSLYAGGSLRGGTFRVADNFGRSRGRPAFDRQIVDYREMSVGGGARWQIAASTALHIGIGQMLDRRFNFHDRNLLLNGDGAPTAQLTFTSAF